MPKSDSVRRIRNYDLAVTPARVAEMFEKRKAEMVERQAQATNELYRVELGVKEVLASEPVSVMEYLGYYDFARETYRCQKQHVAGYGLVHEVQILINKWVLRKCDERILHRIRFDVFGIQSEEQFQPVISKQVDPRIGAPSAAESGLPPDEPAAKSVKSGRGGK